jgi:hypothetical protein
MRAGHGSKRAQQEDAALAALLSEPTIADAATRAGISEATLYRWLADRDFRARHRDARRQVVEHAVCALQRATSTAVATLERNLICAAPAAEISAAKAVLDFAIKGIELVDLSERIQALEQASEQAAEREKGGRP